MLTLLLFSALWCNQLRSGLKILFTGVYGGDAGNYNLEMTKVGYAGAANPLQVIEDPLYKKDSGNNAF